MCGRFPAGSLLTCPSPPLAHGRSKPLPRHARRETGSRRCLGWCPDGSDRSGGGPVGICALGAGVPHPTGDQHAATVPRRRGDLSAAGGSGGPAAGHHLPDAGCWQSSVCFCSSRRQVGQLSWYFFRIPPHMDRATDVRVLASISGTARPTGPIRQGVGRRDADLISAVEPTPEAVERFEEGRVSRPPSRTPSSPGPGAGGIGLSPIPSLR